MLLILLSSLPAKPGTTPGLPDQDLQYSSKGGDAAIITYLPKVLSATKDTIKGMVYTRMRLEKCHELAEPGRPVLPYRTLYLAIPQGGRISWRILQSEFKDINDCRIALAITDRQDSLAVSRSTPDITVYKMDGFFPADVCQTDAPGQFRKTQVVAVHLYPMQYDPARHILRLYSKLVVQFDIISSTSGLAKSNQAGQKIEPAFDAMLQEKILNYDMARPWRSFATPAANSSMNWPAGTWFQIPVSEDAFYKVTYQQLRNLYYDSLSIKPDLMGIYYGSGQVLATGANEPQPETRQVASEFYDANGDGLFGKSDFLLFYGQGTSGWSYDPEQKRHTHYTNPFTNENVYWLYIGSQIRRKMHRQNSDAGLVRPSTKTDRAVGRIFGECEIYNDEKSGYNWWWDRLTGTSEGRYTISLFHPVENDSATIRVYIKGTNELYHNLSFTLNHHLLGRAELPYTLARTYAWSAKNILTEGDNEFQISLRSTGVEKSQVFFDWYELEYHKKLMAENGRLEFWSEKQDKVYEYHVRGADQN